jgi:carbonic anhydrase
VIYMPLSDSSKPQTFDKDIFADVLKHNQSFVSTFQHEELTGTAKEGIAIVTCMDSRISPLAVVGMKPGDAKILRNAGALGVKRILIMPHTDCRMAAGDEAAIHEKIRKEHGVDTRSLEFRTVSDQRAALITDVIRVRSYPLLNNEVVVGGAIYNVSTGLLEPVDA